MTGIATQFADDVAAVDDRASKHQEYPTTVTLVEAIMLPDDNRRSSESINV